MTRSHICLVAMSVLCVCSLLAQEDRTFTVEVGSFPWHDRVDEWAISKIPDRYVSDKPVPQQSCTDRTLVLPAAGADAVHVGVLAKELDQFLDKFPALADTGDRMQIRKGGAVLDYAIVIYSDPPLRTAFKFSNAGVILLSWGGDIPAPTQPAAPVAVPADTPMYVPADGVCPWHDREGRWVIRDLPEEFAGGSAVPQQSCGDRTLVLPAGVTEIAMAVSDTNLSEFQRRYPRVRDTGLGLTITGPGGGQRLPYSIIVFPNPPLEGDFKDFTTAGIVLLRLAGADVTAPVQPPAEGARNVLDQDQEFVAQEWPGSPGERTVRMWVQEPPAGITANTGLMLVLHNWGGVYDSSNYKAWCRTFAECFNVVAMSVNYLQSGPDWQDGSPYDHGYLQAMDAIGALYTVRGQLADAGVAFNEHRIYAMGGSGGGNVTEMAMKLAPHTFACGVDICGMPGLIDAIAFGTGERTALNAGYSRDPNAANYLSPDMQRIRDFGDLEHCRLLARANPNLRIVIAHGVNDHASPVAPKIRQCANMIEAGLNVDGHFLTDRDVDGEVIANTGHAVGNREQVVIKFADEYMREDGDLPCATAGPSDFERGGTFAYPTDNGRFVIDFSGYPTISFQAN